MGTPWTVLYDLFLDGITSCTLAECTDIEIRDQLDTLVKGAISTFRYPRISLEFTLIPNAATGENEYYFVNELTVKELGVLIHHMKTDWFRWQLAKENNFSGYYFDSNARTHSQGNLIQQLNKAIEQQKDTARTAESDYYRVNESGKPAIGDIKW